jgi:hypothetical protein
VPSEPIDLLAVAGVAGLELNQGVLDRLELPRLVYPLPVGLVTYRHVRPASASASRCASAATSAARRSPR